jgi:Protein of unknown function (DUF3667)
MEQHTCTNCGNVFTGQFCNHCGQKLSHRYTIGHVLHELLHVFTHADKGIFSFAWQLLYKPGHIANDLIEGRRKRYFNLFQYLVITLGIITYLVNYTNFMERTAEAINSATNLQYSKQQLEFQQKFGIFYKKYMNIIQFGLIPLYAWVASWFYRKTRKINYAENIVLQSTIIAQTTTIGIILMAIFYLLPDKFFYYYNILGFISMFTCYTIAFCQFYKTHWLKNLLFAILIPILSILILSILALIIGIGIGFIIKSMR